MGIQIIQSNPGHSPLLHYLLDILMFSFDIIFCVHFVNFENTMIIKYCLLEMSLASFLVNALILFCFPNAVTV